MSYILNLESSSTNCSVSLALNGNLIIIKEINSENYSHSVQLHSFIKEILKKSNVLIEELSAVAISKGPGSYTGLRIGAAAAKGLCYALNIPLISVSTLLILAHQIKIEKGLIVPVIDARRDEVYFGVFDPSYNVIENPAPRIITSKSFKELLNNNKIYFVGSGQKKCESILQKNSNLIFSFNNSLPSSNEMARISNEKFNDSIFENLAYFEPDYLKKFSIN